MKLMYHHIFFHLGDASQRDNTLEYGIIKQWVIEGPGRSYIPPYDKSDNGRLAWLALWAHYKGEGSKNQNVEEAYITLEHIFYEGKKKGFTFEKFLKCHNECFWELEWHGKPVKESKKIWNFLGKIKALKLQAAVQAGRASENLLTSFQEAANFIALSMKPIARPSQRLIALTSGPHYKRGGLIPTTISSIRTEQIEQDQLLEGFIELDTHADISCVEANCRIVYVTKNVCQVHPYHPNYDAIEEVPVVQAATAYDDAETGITYMKIINQALQIPDLETTFLNLNQMHMNGIIVDDIPKHLAPNPEIATHSINVPNTDLHITLKLKGIISAIKRRYWSVYKIENCPWVDLTSSKPWNPKSGQFEEQEEKFEKHNASINYDLTPDRYIYALKTNHLCLQQDTQNDTMLNEMVNMVHIMFRFLKIAKISVSGLVFPIE